MKQFLSLLAAAACLTACNNPSTTATTTKTDSTAPVAAARPTVYTVPAGVPYKVQYGSWSLGDPQNVKMMLDMYKNWDDNKIDVVAAACADTFRLDNPNGYHVTLTKATILDSLKKWRNMSTSLSSDIIVALPLHSPDKNEDWVCIWCVNHWTDKKGKTDSSFSNDNWQIKMGKIAYMTSLEQHFPKKK
jgi:hypothetical protein